MMSFVIEPLEIRKEQSLRHLYQTSCLSEESDRRPTPVVHARDLGTQSPASSQDHAPRSAITRYCNQGLGVLPAPRAGKFLRRSRSVHVPGLCARVAERVNFSKSTSLA